MHTRRELLEINKRKTKRNTRTASARTTLKWHDESTQQFHIDEVSNKVLLKDSDDLSQIIIQFWTLPLISCAMSFFFDRGQLTFNLFRRAGDKARQAEQLLAQDDLTDDEKLHKILSMGDANLVI